LSVQESVLGMNRVIRQDQFEDSAITRFNTRFSLPARPSVKPPDLPNHLDDLDDGSLMDLYSEFMAWVSYAKGQLVKAEIEEDREATKCRVTDARVLIEQWGADAKGDRVTIAKARRDVDPRVTAQQDTYQTARAYRKLVEALFESCERGAQLLSRELSRRIGLSSKEGRTSRFGA
jgi:hypothetical protein